MGNEITSVANEAFADGPSSSPSMPPKALIRLVFSIIQALIDQVTATSSVGIKWADPVRALANSNINLSSGLVNGAVVDGVVVATGQRVLLTAQTVASQNGIYIVASSGAASRSTDADTSSELSGLGVFVTDGTVYGGSAWVCATPNPIVVGTTALTFRKAFDSSVINATLNELVRSLRSAAPPISGLNKVEFSDDTGWLWRLGNIFGATSAGLDLDGVFHARAKFDAGVPALTDDLAKVFLTESGYILAGVDWDGVWKSAAEIARDVDVFAAQVSGSSKVFASGASVVPLTFGSEVGLQPRRRGRFARYFVPSGSTYVARDEEIIAKSSALATVTRLVHSVLYGQSLSKGDVASPAVSTSAVRPGRALMFSGGAVVNGVSNDAAALATPVANEFSLVDLFEAGQESPGSQLGFELSRPGGMPATDAVVVSGHGKGATAYSGLKKGTVPYANLISGIRRGRIIAGLNGQDYAVPYVSYIQGEENVSDALATYKGYLAELRADLNSDIQPFLASAADVVLFVDQISNWTKYGAKPTRSDVPLAQLQAFIDDPTKVICVCPKYFLPSAADGIHLLPASSAILGAYHGRAHRQTRLGTPWKPLYITSAVRTANKVLLTYNVPSGALAIDTSVVSFIANFGFEWADNGDGNAVTISSVASPVGNTIEVTLSGTPTATGQKIGYARTGVSNNAAGPATGARGNVRDSATDTTSSGYVMRNWACHQLVNVI